MNLFLYAIILFNFSPELKSPIGNIPVGVEFLFEFILPLLVIQLFLHFMLQNILITSNNQRIVLSYEINDLTLRFVAFLFNF